MRKAVHTAICRGMRAVIERRKAMNTLFDFAEQHPEEYAAMAEQANLQGKVLALQNGILVLTDIQPNPPSVSAAQIRAKRNHSTCRS